MPTTVPRLPRDRAHYTVPGAQREHVLLLSGLSETVRIVSGLL